MTQKSDSFDVDNNYLLLPYSLQHLDFLQKASAALDILLLFIGLNSFFFWSSHHYFRHGDGFGILSGSTICSGLFNILKRVLASWAWSLTQTACDQVPAASSISGVTSSFRWRWAWYLSQRVIRNQWDFWTHSVPAESESLVNVSCE